MVGSCHGAKLQIILGGAVLPMLPAAAGYSSECCAELQMCVHSCSLPRIDVARRVRISDHRQKRRCVGRAGQVMPLLEINGHDVIVHIMVRYAT